MSDTLPNILNKIDRDRLNRYRQYLDFYGGQHWPAASGSRAPAACADPGGEIDPDRSRAYHTTQ